MAVAQRGRPTRVDTWRITVKVAGHEFGVWDSKTGGEVSSESTVYKPGGMGPPIALAGQVTTSPVILNRLFTLDDDLLSLQLLFNLAGKGNATVTQTALDPDGNVNGPPIVYVGKLTRVAPPTHDSNSQDAARVEIEIAVTGTPVVI
jgi:hypothetical protein